MTKTETRTTYTAVFEYDADGMWIVELAEEPRVHTYGRTLVKARDHIRDAAALWFETDLDDLELVEEFRLPRPVQANVSRARQGRERAEAAQEKAAEATLAAAKGLVHEVHMSMRDAADVLGLSHQRIQQLLGRDSVGTDRSKS